MRSLELFTSFHSFRGCAEPGRNSGRSVPHPHPPLPIPLEQEPKLEDLSHEQFFAYLRSRTELEDHYVSIGNWVFRDGSFVQLGEGEAEAFRQGLDKAALKYALSKSKS